MLLPLHLSILNGLTKIQFPKFNLFPKRHHNSHQKTAPLPFSPVQHPPLPSYTHKNFHSNDNLITQHDTSINNPVTSNADTPIKYIHG